MNIENYIEINPHKEKDFKFKTKFTPKRTLNKITDNIKVTLKKKSKDNDTYILNFTKKVKDCVKKINLKLQKNVFKYYVDFICDFYDNCMSESKFKISEFVFEEKIRITLKKLNNEYIKISSELLGENNSSRVFFVLSNNEFLAYIKILKGIYTEASIESCMNHELIHGLNYLTNPISKRDKDELYLDTLYSMIDSALDSKNEEIFKSISSEIDNILKATSLESSITN